MATVTIFLAKTRDSSRDYMKGYSVPSRSSERIPMQPCQVIL